MVVPLLIVATLAADPAYLSELRSEDDFFAVSQESASRPDITHMTKYLAPADGDPSLLPTVYQNVRLYPFHITFMSTEFPDRFPGLTSDEYRSLVELRGSRRYFAGVLYRLQPERGGVSYGFDLYTDPGSPLELPNVSEVNWIYQRIGESFSVGPLAYAPTRVDAIADAFTWEDPPFPIYFAEAGVVGDYRAYVTGTAYGRVRIFALGDLVEASGAGSLSWQDIVAVDAAPADLTAPVAAVLTGTAQTELSHLSLRLSQRGTPNAFDVRAVERFTPYRDALVRIDIEDSGVTVTAVEDPREAEDWWASHRPRLPSIPAFDLGPAQFTGLDAMSAEPGAAAIYGAKAAGMALVRAALPPEYTVTGFGIPFHWYDWFMSSNRVGPPGGGTPVSYAEYLARLEEDEAFRTDPVLRTQMLESFVDHVEKHGVVPDELAGQAAAALVPRWATPLGDILLDMEFKIRAGAERAVIFKQARPFLRPAAGDAPTLALVVPPGTSICGVFVDNRTLAEEYALLSSARLIPGRLELPARAGAVDADLLEDLRIGPAQSPAVPRGPGRLSCLVRTFGTRTFYQYAFDQEYDVPEVSDAPLTFAIPLIEFWTEREGPDRTELVLDDDFLIHDLSASARIREGPGQTTYFSFASCTHESLPLHAISVVAETGEEATLHLRIEPPGNLSKPANLVWASVTFDGVTREVGDYWHLVYSADHHNWNERFWIVLDPPQGEVHAVEIRDSERDVEGSEPVFALLDAQFRVLGNLRVTAWNRERISDPLNPEFRRGDTTEDGKVNIADAIRTLLWLFGGGGDLACPDAADANDDGSVNLADAIRILGYLFAGGGDLPWPGVDECGRDDTTDELPHCLYDVSRC